MKDLFLGMLLCELPKVLSCKSDSFVY